MEPLLAANDPTALVGFLKHHYRKRQIMELLFSPVPDARKVAAVALALVGCKRCVDDLLRQLRDPDPLLNQLSEHALWSIWLRSGTPPANHQLHRGCLAMHQWELDHAVRHFDRAIELDPAFAEAFNQRAIAHYLADRHEASIEDCLATLERMPGHFGAWSGMGHCHANLGQYDQAARCYEKSLEINPHLSCIRETLAAMGE